VFILASATDDTEGDNPYYVPVNDENQFVFNKFSIPYMSMVTFFLTLFISF